MQDHRTVGGGTAEPSAGGPSALETLPNGAVRGSDLNELLRALQAMRMGDFTVRMAAEFDRAAWQDRRYLQ